MKRIVAIFFQTAAGGQPVRDWLLNLDDEDRKIVGRDIARVEFGWPLGMPVCKNIRRDIWEVRSTIKKGKSEARTYFGIDGQTMILLAGHDGKADQGRAIDVALDRWKDYRQRKKGTKK